MKNIIKNISDNIKLSNENYFKIQNIHTKAKYFDLNSFEIFINGNENMISIIQNVFKFNQTDHWHKSGKGKCFIKAIYIIKYKAFYCISVNKQ